MSKTGYGGYASGGKRRGSVHGGNSDDGWVDNVNNYGKEVSIACCVPSPISWLPEPLNTTLHCRPLELCFAAASEDLWYGDCRLTVLSLARIGHRGERVGFHWYIICF